MFAPLDRIRDDLWEEACRREDVLRELIERFPDRSPVSAVDDACSLLGVSRATLYRLIERFKAQKNVSSLLARKPGRAVGSKGQVPARDLLIRRTIERLYLTPERATFARLVNEFRLLCVQDGLPPPSWRTVKARLSEFDLARKHGPPLSAPSPRRRRFQANTARLAPWRSSKSITPGLTSS